ncbi:MAG TPA: hypothetical protein VD833_03035 [Vicinamibacterales bacterium]|nr:hypothetical protein [Vicinamibacterales bacterium]
MFLVDALDPRPPRRVAAFGLVVATLVVLGACQHGFRHSRLPALLSDQEFWDLVTRLSGPPGPFTHSDNLVSNELLFATTVQGLRPRGGVYLGVGPEQNFSYIAAIRPDMAFVIDIRQENRNLHLLYKVLFEASADRVEFVFRLFSRERPPGIGPTASVQDLFGTLAAQRPSRARYEATARLVRERLVHAHGYALAPADVAWIESALHAFYSDGPDIHYGRTRPQDPPGPSYRALMTATALGGRSQSYLASEEAFAFVKGLHTRNLIVPVVGDFAGPHAIPRTGDYIREREGLVSAFYGSNVEVYLTRRQAAAFCGNLARLPYGPRTWFIHSKGVQRFGPKVSACQAGGS